jgi:hypothetical protein
VVSFRRLIRNSAAHTLLSGGPTRGHTCGMSGFMRFACGDFGRTQMISGGRHSGGEVLVADVPTAG